MDQILEAIQNFVTTQLFVSVHVLLIIAHVLLIAVAYAVYLERKISAYIQDRMGPNRVGFDFGLPFLKFLSWEGPLKGLWGLGQPLADGVKFLLKEDFTPRGVDKLLFSLAPVLIIIPALIGFVVIPWGGVWNMPGPFNLPLVGPIGGEPVYITGAHVNVGIIYLLAVASVGVYGVTLGGWASNSKYSFLGGLRSTAQMISYEIPLGLSLLAVLLMVGTVMPEGIIGYQAKHGWNVLAQPLGCVLFFICALAEANRAPFDNAEAEQELVGGYHTEYSSMRFALFFLAEYMHMFTSSAFWVLLFFGGYHLPFLELTDPASTSLLAVLAKFGVYFAKVVLVIAFMMVIRWTLPRLRYDQVMMLGWQTLIPMALTLVVSSSVMVYLGFTPAEMAERMRGSTLVGIPLATFPFMPMLAVSGLVLVGVYLGQTLLPSSTANRKVPMYGSRFAPVPGTRVVTAPTNPMAVEDRPVQGTRIEVGA